MTNECPWDATDKLSLETTSIYKPRVAQGIGKGIDRDVHSTWIYY